MPLNPEDFNHHLSVLLSGRENKEQLINDLHTGITTAQGDATKLISAWNPIVEILNKDYWVSRDDTKKFNKVSPVIKSLELIVSDCVEQFNGKTTDLEFMGEKIAQLFFKCSNYYSIASTLDQDNLDNCTSWLEKAGVFIRENGLENTRSHAVWHNLIGGHESRQYQMGRMTEHPETSIDHFREAVRIHSEVFGRKINDPNAVELRHVTMCLGSTLAQKARGLVLAAAKSLSCIEDGEIEAFYTQLDTTLKKITDEAHQFLSQLSDDYLILADGSPDLYRRAGTRQYMSYLKLLEGDFDEACKLIDDAAKHMDDSLTTTSATGQLAQILNDVAKTCDAKAAFCRFRSMQLCGKSIEKMYADNAEHDFASTCDNPFSQMGGVIFNLTQYRRTFAIQSDASTSSESVFKPFTLGAGVKLLFESHSSNASLNVNPVVVEKSSSQLGITI